MSVAKLLVSFIDSKKGLQEYFRIKPEEFLFRSPTERALYKSFTDHITKYHTLPSYQTLQEFDLSTVLPSISEVVEPPEYYLDKIKERHIFLSMKKVALGIQDCLNNQQPYEALEATFADLLSLRREQLSSQLLDYAQDGYDIIKTEYLKKLSDVNSGIKTGWPTLDEMAGGLGKGDIITIVGRPASGKSFLSLYMAEHAWREQGKTPLFISMEMGVIPVVERLTALNTHTPIKHIKMGELHTEEELQPMMTQLLDNKNKREFWIVDGNLSVGVDDTIALCQQLNPDVVFIDGAYLLRHPDKRLNRYDRVSENIEWIKRDIAERLGIPCVLSYQFNRDAVTKHKNKEAAAGLEYIAYSDAIGQVSSLVLGLLQPESVETIHHRDIDILKGRSGESGKFRIRWEFDHPNPMDFSEELHNLPNDLHNSYKELSHL